MVFLLYFTSSKVLRSLCDLKKKKSVNVCMCVQPCVWVIKTKVLVCAAICFRQNNDLYFVTFESELFQHFLYLSFFLFGCVLWQWTLLLRFFVLVVISVKSLSPVSVIYVWIFIADFLFTAVDFCFFFEFKDMNCADNLTS